MVSEVDKQKRLAWKREDNRRNPQRYQTYNLRSRYKASHEVVEGFYKDCEEQQGRCCICGEVATHQGVPKLVFDHNHKTGEYRGAICQPCNATIGNARESIDRLEKIIIYLKGQV